MVSTQSLSIYSQQYTFESPRHQDFSLPTPFLEYISQNGAIYEKLIQTCKYFFARHQLVPMEFLELKKSYFWPTPYIRLWDYDEVTCRLFKDEFTINLKKTKLWIYGKFTCWDKRSNLSSSFLKSVYRFTPSLLSLSGQHIEVKDFDKMSTNVEYFEIYGYIKVFFPGKIEASLWDILTMMPKLERCFFVGNTENPLPLSPKNYTMQVLPNLKYFNFSWLPIADFPMFSNFIKLHPNTKFEINIVEERIDLKAFKTLLGEAFPNTTFTRIEMDRRWVFQCTLESHYVKIDISWD